jgi:hypothetical protein
MATNSANTAKKSENTEQKFAVEKLRNNSIQLFGVPTSTFDGAMYGRNKEEYTVNEVKSIIDKWLYGDEKEVN